MMKNKNQIIFGYGSSSPVSIEEKILEIIENTKIELNIAMYRFLNEDILNAITERVEEGVKLNMVLDTSVSPTDEYSGYFFERIAEPLQKLQQENPKTVRIHFMKDDVVMHHKLLISDRRILVTGSYNMTRSAEEKNLENIFIYNANENENVMNEALKNFFSMFGESFNPKPLEISKISIRKGAYVNKTFTAVSGVYDDNIFILRGMSLSFWFYGEGIFCIEARNRYGRSIVVEENHFLYDTDVDDDLQVHVHGTDGTCKKYSYIIRLMPWKLPYSEEFGKHMDERFKLLTQKLKYAGLI